MNLKEYRIRAQRFLNGDFRCDDLNALFLLFRNKPYGCETIRDIGNMRGHADLRDRGISLERIRDQFQMLRLTMWRFSQNDNAIDLSFCPGFLFDSMNAVIVSSSLNDINLNLRMNRKQIIRAMGCIRSKFQDFSLVELPDEFPRYLWEEDVIPKMLRLVGELEDHEIELIKFCTSRIIIKSPYGRGDLEEEFSKILAIREIIPKNEISISGRCKDLLAMFAVYAIHDVEYDLPDGFIGKSYAGVSNINGSLRIVSSVSIGIRFPKNKYGSVRFNIFDSELNPEDWVDEKIFKIGEFDWSVPLELDGSGKLTEIRLP